MRSFVRGNQTFILLSLYVALAAACGQSGEKSKTGPADSADTGQGGGSGTGAGQGGDSDTGGPQRATGSPCDSDRQCIDSQCITEGLYGWPAGYCSGLCSETCADGAVCSGGSCLKGCTTSADCREGYACADRGEGVMTCMPACTADAQCALSGKCDTERGTCAPAPESLCDDFKDNDSDSLTDCEDPTGCQGKPICRPGDKDVGQPCAASNECKATGGDPMCMSERGFGWPKGSCSEFCPLGQDGACSGDGVCVAVGLPSGNGLCFDACNADADCPTAGYACTADAAGVKVCRPHCTQDAECAGFCNQDTSLCAAANEDCANGSDDDGDNRADCQDMDCAATCQPMLSGACAAATAAQATNHGDTTGGSNLYTGSCTGGAGNEQLYTITPGAAGQVGLLSITLHSASNLGVYVRSSCMDAGSELGCWDFSAAGEDETIKLAVAGGQPYTIFVDSVRAVEAGPFDIDVTFTAAVCGDGAVVSPEECDDGNTTPGDGCDANCKIEADNVCNNVPQLLPMNVGNTTDGSAAFEGSCDGGGGALERIYAYTPPSDGTLEMVLSSDSDQGMYVRTACGDANSEVDCADFEQGGMDEALSVQVKAGVTIYVFVDGYESPADAGPYTLTTTLTP